jgi:hypothetical protein
MDYYSKNQLTRGGDYFPARLRPEHVAEILGFAPPDIPILVSKRHLKPLGKPMPNATKFFSRTDVLAKSVDDLWLARATQTIYDHWKGKNQRKKNSRFLKAA